MDQGDIDLIAGRMIEQIEANVITVVPFKPGKMTSDYEERKAMEDMTNALMKEMRTLYGLPSNFTYDSLLPVLNLRVVLDTVEERVDEYLMKKDGWEVDSE